MDTEIMQEIILSHYRDPRCRVELDDDLHVHTAKNPACGDVMRLQIRENEDGLLIQHRSEGCAASVASCSIMCEMLSGEKPSVVRSTIDDFLESMTAEDPKVEGRSLEWQSLLHFRHQPSRAFCVMLPWQCARNALAEGIDNH
ncbi:MAG: iron-sulfur cluster assembly scaffold protein [Opitutales bacterium]|nr:iron-sulfur cluster assembly scaffold protein [Opitutales bacterium]